MHFRDNYMGLEHLTDHNLPFIIAFIGFFNNNFYNEFGD
ncbi:MAG: hypothetical protein JWP94_2208 [Mucilaginibacter sp.]|nr:hypothetical protein [Mucilaginibacter sp.]